MNPATMSCPRLPELVDWFDGLLDPSGTQRVEDHLEVCEPCRHMLLDWSQQVAGADSPETDACLDDESLLAYGLAPATFASATAAGIEHHLRECGRCTQALQQAMRACRQLERDESAVPSPVPSLAIAAERERAGAAPAAAGVVGTGMAARWWEHLRALFTPVPWSGTAWVAVGVLVLVIGVSRFLMPADNESDRIRDAGQATTVEVSVDTVGYARPALDEPAVVQLAHGSRARWLEKTGTWTRIELADGRRVWVETKVLVTERRE